MSGSITPRALVTVLFVVVGLPFGLCTMSGLSYVLYWVVDGRTPLGPLLLYFGIPALISLAIFGLMLWLLVMMWRRNSP